jgi:hypothetical protein
VTEPFEVGAVGSVPVAPDAASVYVVDWESVPDLAPILDPTHLAVACYPSGWRPDQPPTDFVAVIDDGAETTIVCAESAVEALGGQPVTVELGWRRITFPGPLPWELVGFLADVAGRLASARIPLAAMAGFTTDHVLVRAAQADLAVSVLRGQAPPALRPGIDG